MALVAPTHTPLLDTLPLSVIPESLSFEQKLQRHLGLFAKVLFKESTNDIALLSREALEFASASYNTPAELTVGIGRTPAWQREMLCTAFREISEWARSSIDERSFIPGSVGALALVAEMMFLELARANPETQLLSPGSLRAATEISRSCISQKSQSRILIKNIQLVQTLKTLRSGVCWALEILALYRKTSPVEQELIDTPYIPTNPDHAPGQINQLVDPKVLHRTLVDVIGPTPRSIELQGLLMYSAALTLWMSIYDELLWVIQYEWIHIGPRGNFSTNTCLHLDLHLATLTWQILEQYRKYQDLSAPALRNLILSEQGYPSGDLQDFRDISSIPLEQICRGFVPANKKCLIELIRFSPKRFWDTGFPRESLIWFLRQNPVHIERALSLLRQLPLSEVSNPELIRLLELWISGRQAKWLRTSADVVAILTESKKQPNLYVVTTPVSPAKIPDSTQTVVAAVPAQKVVQNPATVALTPAARQQERLKQLSANYSLPIELEWVWLLDKKIIDACFTYAKRSHQLYGWNPSQYATKVLEAFSSESQEPLIRYYTSLALKSTLRVLHTNHPFDENTRIALISQQKQNLSERKLFVVDRLTEFLKVVDPALTSSTHSSNPVGTGGISDKLSERIRSILPHTGESDEHFLSRTLTFKWIDNTNRAALVTHWDRRGIRIMSALENEATGVFACIEVLTRLPELLSMDHGRVDGRGVSKIVQQLLRDWNKIENRSFAQK